ncbi:ketopantoate reductase [Nitzschia inconspicua]|uniref:Ketopantoate reductase n=1 Tax=Nitzschia inconspicua TaxID=303405 RepID=A0A9K3M278_9STRA|nr:ketopantoate reductase [Nitzschia inconspicua]
MMKVLLSLFLIFGLLGLRIYGIDAFQCHHQTVADEKARPFRRRRVRLQQGTSPPSVQHKTIAIVGTGAVGGFYGAKLWEAGYNVKFQMRGDNLQTSMTEGFQVTSIDGNIFIPPYELSAFEHPEECGPVDWVIVALKSSSLHAIPELILPLLDPQRTRILVIMNGLIEEDLIHALKEHTGEDNTSVDSNLKCCAALYAGMALICANRIAPAHVDHSYAGLLNGGLAASNPYCTADDNKQAYLDLWQPTSVTVDYEDSVLAGRWRKCLWNLPFNGISVAMGGITVDKIVLDPALRKLAYQVMAETIAAGNADLTMHNEPKEVFLCDDDKHRMMDLSDKMGPYRTSTMLDFVEGRPMEVKYLFTKPVERAQKLGIPVPRLETLVAQIEALERLRQ